MTDTELDVLLAEIMDKNIDAEPFIEPEPPLRYSTTDELLDYIDRLVFDPVLDQSKQDKIEIYDQVEILPAAPRPTWEEVCDDIGWYSPPKQKRNPIVCSYIQEDALDGIKPKPVKNKKKLKSILFNTVFWIAIASVLASAFILTGKDGSPRNVLGFSIFTVLTESMQSEIPKGSLVITQHADPDAIKIGDDVTYIKEDKSTVTHRVVSIYENYDNNGARGFETRGIENPLPDEEIVYADNVIGVVKFHTSAVGDILSYIRSNMFMVIIIFAVLIALFCVLKIFLRERKKEKLLKQTGDSLRKEVV